MRILVLDTYYPAFLAAHYGRNPGLRHESYAEQLASLMACSFGTSDAYSVHLREHGHEASDLIVNCTELQLRWADENGHARLARAARAVPAGPARSLVLLPVLRRIAAAQISRVQPDLVYVQDVHALSAIDLGWLRKQGARIVGQTASGMPGARRLRVYDLLLTSFPHYVERFRRLGVPAEYFPIGFDERVIGRLRARGIDPAAAPERASGAVFVGGLSAASHSRGLTLLERVSQSLPVDVWGYGATDLPPDSPVLRRYRGEAWGLDMYVVLATARIAINRHIDAGEGQANNMRLFEATGMGAMLMTEAADNLSDLFEPGREVETYSDADDLAEKLRYYLARPGEAARIAAEGQRRTLENHTYARRIGELSQLLTERFA